MGIENVVGARAKANLLEMQAAAVDDLTEDGGAISGTNDGDLPDLAGSAQTLFENSGPIGGTNDANLPDLTTPDAATNAAAIREVANAYNSLVVDRAIDRTAIQELAAKVNELIGALRQAGIIASQ